MKQFIVYAGLILISLTISFSKSRACSMFKVTMQGKTMVGNNEDFWVPNTRIWFEPGDNESYGAMYVGFAYHGVDDYPQGGMNSEGLVFDGFAMEYLEVKNTEGKKEMTMDFNKEILRTCATVEEVKAILSETNLSGLATGLLLFVDKTGKYLIAEGDSLIIGNDPYYIQSNFYPSLTNDLDDVQIEFYQKGRKYLEAKQDTSLQFCATMMDTMHQDWGTGGTQYTSIYDLNNKTVYLYANHDYSTLVKFNLEKELSKGYKMYKIPDLFPANKELQNTVQEYNFIEESLQSLVSDEVVNDSIKFKQIVSELENMKVDYRFNEYFFPLIQQLNNIDYTYSLKVLGLYIEEEDNAYSVYKEIFSLWDKTLMYNQLRFSNIMLNLNVNENFNEMQESLLNSVGYVWLKQMNFPNYAIQIFATITRKNKNSWNAFDSLAEAYLADNQLELALENYETSVSLNPENKNGIEKINELKEKLKSE